jgi:hypothetical protein
MAFSFLVSGVNYQVTEKLFHRCRVLTKIDNSQFLNPQPPPFKNFFIVKYWRFRSGRGKRLRFYKNLKIGY